MEDNSNIFLKSILNENNNISKNKTSKKYKLIKVPKRIPIKDNNKKKITKENVNTNINKFVVKNTNIKKERNPGIDLVRLIAMYGTILNHIIYMKGVKRKYPQYSKNLKILHIATGWHNDAFALISGIVGYKSNKYANLLYLWLYVTFYSVGIHLYKITILYFHNFYLLK